MPELKTSVRISILDAFSAPLRKMLGELTEVSQKFAKVKIAGNVSAPIHQSAAAVTSFGRAAAVAMDGAGADADDARKRYQAFAKVAELQSAVAGARKFERDTRAAMNASGGDADAAAKHFEAFGKMEGLQQALSEAKRFERGLRQSTGNAGRSVAGIAKPNRAAAVSFASLSRAATESLRQTNGKLDETGSHLRAFEKLAELRRAEEGFKRVARAAGTIGPQLHSIGPEMRNAARQAASFRDSLRGIADATIALGGLKAVVQGAASVMRVPIAKFATFDEALGELESKTGLKRESVEFQQLEAQSKEVGARTKFTPEDIALSQAEFAATGFKPSDILKAAPVAANLATAGSTPRDQILPDQAASIMTASLAQFGLTADASSQLADQLIAGADASRSSVTELSTQLKYAGDVAKRFGMSSGQAISMLTLLSDQGQDGTTAGTNFREMMSRFAAPTDEAKGALKQVGVDESVLAQIQRDAATGNVSRIMTQLQSTLGKVEPEKRLFVLQKAFGDTGGAAANALMNRAVPDAQGVTDIDRRFMQVADSTGITDRKAAIKEKTAAGQLEAAGGALDALAVNIGSKFAPEIKKTTALVSEASSAMSKWADEYPDLAKLGVAVAAVGASLGTLWGVIAGGKALLGSLAGMLGIGGAAAAPAAIAAGAEGAALAAAASEVAVATAGAAEAVGAIGATAAASTGATVATGAAAAGASTLATVALPVTAAIGGSYLAEEYLGKATDEFFEGGGFKTQFQNALEAAGVNNWATELGASVGGTIANSIAETGTDVARMPGKLVKMGVDYFTGDEPAKPIAALPASTTPVTTVAPPASPAAAATKPVAPSAPTAVPVVTPASAAPVNVAVASPAVATPGVTVVPPAPAAAPNLTVAAPNVAAPNVSLVPPAAAPPRVTVAGTAPVAPAPAVARTPAPQTPAPLFIPVQQGTPGAPGKPGTPGRPGEPSLPAAVPVVTTKAPPPVDTEELERLGRQQLEATREQTKMLEKLARESRDAANRNRRAGGPAAGGIIGAF